MPESIHDVLMRLVSGTLRAARHDHGPDVSDASRAKRIVSALLADYDLAPKRPGSQTNRRRKNHSLERVMHGGLSAVRKIILQSPHGESIMSVAEKRLIGQILANWDLTEK